MSATPGASAASRLLAWGVHLLTASGVVWGLLALSAIEHGALKAALGWMALSLAVDGIDGSLARRLRIARVLPSIKGDLLDNLVDYLNYVLVPAWLLLHAGVLPSSFRLAGAAAILLVSVFQFSHVDAKADGRYFRGFPSYWNVVVFYLLLLGLPGRAAIAIVAALCVLVFVPVLYVYPSKTTELRPTTLVLTAAWGLAVLALGLRYPAHSPLLLYGSMLYFVYYFGLSVALSVRARTRRAYD